MSNPIQDPNEAIRELLMENGLLRDELAAIHSRANDATEYVLASINNGLREQIKKQDDENGKLRTALWLAHEALDLYDKAFGSMFFIELRGLLPDSPDKKALQKLLADANKASFSTRKAAQGLLP